MTQNTPHKLFISANYTLKKNQFGDLLREKELPRGEVIAFEFKVKNIGDNIFLGGVVNKVVAEYAHGGMSGMQTSDTLDHVVPSLQPKEEKLLLKWSLSTRLEGLIWLKCYMKSNDNQPIEFFQVLKPPHSLGTDGWYTAFTIINRENLMTIRLLREILSLYKQPKKAVRRRRK